MKRVRYLVLWAGIAALAWWQRDALWQLAALALLSSTFAYLISPLASLLERRVSEKWGAALAFLAVAAALIAILWLLIPMLLRQIEATTQMLPDLLDKATVFIQGIQETLHRGGLPEELLDSFYEWWDQAGQGLMDAAGGAALSFGRGLLSMGWVLLSPVAAFYLLRDRHRILPGVERMIPSTARPLVLHIARGAKELLGQYVRGQVLVSLSTGATTALGLWLVGLPSWLLMGALMVFFNLIPYFGPFMGAIPIALFAALDGWGMVFRAVAVVVAAQQIESIFVSPHILSGAVQLHPLTVIAVLFFGGAVGGIAGMVFAIPVVLLLRVIAQRVLEKRVRNKSG